MQTASVSILATVQQYLDAWAARDGQCVLSTFAADGTYTDPTAGTVSGPALAGYVGALCVAFPDLHFDVESIATLDDNTVVLRWLMLGTRRGPIAGRPASGRQIAFPGINVIVVGGGKVRSVRGYFDQKTFYEQVGLQVLLAPRDNDRVQYGVAGYTRTGRTTRPAAFSTTWIDVRDEREQLQVLEGVQQVIGEVAADPAFISLLGAIVGSRMFTATAWTDADAMKRLIGGAAHRKAKQLPMAHGVGSAVHTSAAVVEHQNALWVRCPTCGDLGRNDDRDASCRCGAQLPDPPPYW
jgi:steroid delta-isomerase-like uncharacterized protein